ncbi:pepsin/retropepsin-like aspartic protease family protein [Catalinimonas niigatensis]|uniref:hypothetical protein n=1 Tax=Catalinimonas niigatensis TaxID=1397264 RepID=UPI002665AF35|nr:hypothetical protein [Catalinimonas niigatensis]WPP51679.1 hypothetical protein PZB72_04665 [Catalinimonas niigatensis]
MFEKVARIFIATCVALTLFFLCFIFYRYLFQGSDEPMFGVYLLITFLGLGFLMAWFMRYQPYFLYPQLTAMLLISIAVLIRNLIAHSTYTEQPEAYHEWLSKKERFVLPFQVGKYGHILLKAQVNDTSGLFLFDTGASLSTLHEGIPGDGEFQNEFTLTDAQGLQESKKLRVMDHFQFGYVKVQHMVFWPVDSNAWKQGGAFVGQRQIVGIIGNNFIPNYVWDFDMRNQQVSLAKSIDALDTIHNHTSLPLAPMEGNWKIPVSINGEKKNFLLDFGYITSIRLKDTLLKDDDTKHGMMLSTPKSAFSHTLNEENRSDTLSYTIAKSVWLGDQEFTNVLCFEKDFFDLIGLQFIWAFDRVILNYPDQQIHLIKHQDRPEVLDMKTLNYKLTQHIQMLQHGFFEMTLNHYAAVNTKRITEDQDTLDARYLFYGKSKHWGQNRWDVDSITSMDSVQLPNGVIKQAPVTIDLTNGYFTDP